jgi:hypothetical protein
MRNITISIDDDTYRAARLWSLERDTCVSHVVKAFLKDLPRLDNVRRFPLPSAPNPHSLGARFDRLDPQQFELLADFDALN